ncbi:MAG: hypothetical protein FOGNACKC_06011 [Anaerolineae bacterium]|nr:hypothetical protein [Anaerolineae bacterium]
MHILFADKFFAAKRNAPHPAVFVDFIKLRLVFKLARNQINPIPQPAETFGQFEHVNYLPAGIGLAQFRLGGDVTVR